TALQIPLPSWARSIGYLTELALPLIVEIEPPSWRELAVSWNGGDHRICFRPIRELVAELDRGVPCGEELVILLAALCPPSGVLPRPSDFVPRPDDVWTADRLAASLAETTDARGRRLDVRGEDLRFLKTWRAPHEGRWLELVTPG